jgi:hypothetical protein
MNKKPSPQALEFKGRRESTSTAFPGGTGGGSRTWLPSGENREFKHKFNLDVNNNITSLYELFYSGEHPGHEIVQMVECGVFIRKYIKFHFCNLIRILQRLLHIF